MYATLRPCEVKDVRYAARAVKDVRFTDASRNVYCCRASGFGRASGGTVCVPSSACEGREGGVRRDGYSCVLRDCVTVCPTVLLCGCLTVRLCVVV